MQNTYADQLKELRENEAIRVYREAAVRPLGLKDALQTVGFIRPDFMVCTSDLSGFLVIELKVVEKAPAVLPDHEKQIKEYMKSSVLGGFWETNMKTPKIWEPRQPLDDYYYTIKNDKPVFGLLVCFGRDGNVAFKRFKYDYNTKTVVERN